MCDVSPKIVVFTLIVNTVRTVVRCFAGSRTRKGGRRTTRHERAKIICLQIIAHSRTECKPFARARDPASFDDKAPGSRGIVGHVSRSRGGFAGPYPPGALRAGPAKPPRRARPCPARPWGMFRGELAGEQAIRRHLGCWPQLSSTAILALRWRPESGSATLIDCIA